MCCVVIMLPDAAPALRLSTAVPCYPCFVLGREQSSTSMNLRLCFSLFVGMFATVDGISQRAPVHWSENVIGAALCFPYVVALDDEFITVHSMLDQQQKQTLPFKEGHILQDFEGIKKDTVASVFLEQLLQSLGFVF